MGLFWPRAMGPKKSAKEPPGKKDNAPSNFLTQKQEPVKLNPKPNVTWDKQQDKVDGKNAKPGRESKPKPLSKNIQAGKESAANVKWVLEGKKLYEAAGNKVTLVKVDPHAFEYVSMAMMVEDGAAPVSGDHFWTATFGGTELGQKFFGITNSNWFKEQYGLCFSGVLAKYNGFPQVDFGPVIKSGDVVGALCSFSKGHLNIFFYHNGRCLGLAFQVPVSLFLPEGICPCVKLKSVGSWATIKKEPRENVPKEEERIRAPVSQFGVEGIWKFKSLVDSKTGNPIPLNVKEKKLKTADLTIKQEYEDPSNLFFQLWFTHYVGFTARKMDHNSWIKIESHHMGGTIEKPRMVYDHSVFPDFPIIETISNPEKVEFQDQDMRVTKGEKTVIFYRFYKIRKGNVFKSETLD